MILRSFTARKILIVALAPLLCGVAYAQGRGGRGGVQAPAPAPTGKAGAPFDITGYWLSVVTEDWRYRMVVPPKSDYLGIPLNAEGRKLGDAWDPAKDEASGEQCRSYGAPNVLRVPGRIHITWQDDETLKLETDAGTQTRMFYFGAPLGQGGDWQGVSKASWDIVPVGRGQTPSGGSLKVVTTRLKPGYLRKNGAPYSANTTLTEYFDRINEANGESYLVITTIVEDPVYLIRPYETSVHFKKQADASGWNPNPCTSR
jgi:hypothetical protein